MVDLVKIDVLQKGINMGVTFAIFFNRGQKLQLLQTYEIKNAFKPINYLVSIFGSPHHI